MIAWFLAFFLAPPLLLLDAWLAQVLWPVPALTLGICLFLAASARPRAVPGLLVCFALARSVLVAGDAALHLLALGIPVALLMPLRGVLFRRQLWWQAGAAVFLAVAIPKLMALFGRVALAGPPVAPLEWHHLLGAALVAPVAALLLRHLPPLSVFVERGE